MAMNDDDKLKARMDEILREAGWDQTCFACRELAMRLAKLERDVGVKPIRLPEKQMESP
jgi:hypothetical protein